MKLWSLQHPKINADFVMLDEAQDSNPVVLQVLREQNCQIIYVGDPYQQIYEWRGAINAMDRVATKHRACLTQSFRFGEAIAAAASAVIERLGAKEKLRGDARVTSHLCPVWAETILCRTNMGVMTHLLAEHALDHRCYVLGGTLDLQRLLEDVSRLKRGRQADTPELFGFASWSEVMEFTGTQEGEHLKTFVKLVNEHGEPRLLAEVRRCAESEDDCDVILSTAHKAKGREWKTVLVDSDFESSFVNGQRRTQNRTELESELRLFYVALTRAIEAVELPATLLTHFGLAYTSNDRVGTPRQPRGEFVQPSAAIPFQPASRQPQTPNGGFLKHLFSRLHAWLSKMASH
jgi:superfamily I DNA/RNA helicase